MSDQKTLPRPPQATLAGWITILGSAFVLFSVFGVVAENRSIETREQVNDALGEAPLEGSGIGLQQALDFLHVTALIAGACATIAGILGIWVLQRSRSARLGVTIVAPVLFLSGMVTGGFMSSLVAVAAVMLWMGPSRDWFNGVRPSRPDPDVPRDGQGGRSAGTPASSGPRPVAGFGSPQGGRAPQQDAGPEHEPAGQPDAGQPDAGQPDAGQPDGSHGEQSAYASTLVRDRPSAPAAARPREVLQACLVTWVFSGIVLLVMATAMIAFVTSPDLVREVYESDDRFADTNIDLDQLRGATAVVAGAFMFWSLVAAVLAVFTFLGHNWARITLIVSAAVAGLLGLAMVIAAPLVLLVPVATVLAIVLLTRPGSNEWFVSRSRRDR